MPKPFNLLREPYHYQRIPNELWEYIPLHSNLWLFASLTQKKLWEGASVGAGDSQTMKLDKCMRLFRFCVPRR